MKGCWLILKLFLPLVVAGPICANGWITGVVRDRSGDPITDAKVRVQSEETGARQMVETDASGQYVTTEVAAGSYKVTVRRDGFRTLSQEAIVVADGKSTRVDFVIDILPLQQEVSVAATESDTDPTASGLTMTRGSVPAGSLPQNGREVHALFAIMPGATITPASIDGGGQFSVGGQRPNANEFRVDGMNANVGIGSSSVPGAMTAGSLPGMSSLGGTQSLAAKEETESIELRSGDFDPAYGERPGAQINISTRGGTSEFHGSFFGYIRPRALDSMDWFARAAGEDLGSGSAYGWGGGLGGPLSKQHTFFFASIERIDVKDNAAQWMAVPTLAVREDHALIPYQDLFAAFPLPHGTALSANEALSYSVFHKTGSIENRSIRIDQIFPWHLVSFARYADVPSSSSSTELGTATSQFLWRSATAGLSRSSGKNTHELRFNYTEAWTRSQHTAQDSPAIDQLTQSLGGDFQQQWGVTGVSIPGVGRSISGVSASAAESQLAVTYTFEHDAERHHLRAGYQWTRLVSVSPNDGFPITFGTNTASDSYSSYFANLSIVSPDVNSLLAGVPLGLTGSYGGFPDAIAKRDSYFVADTMRITDRLNVLWGARFDFLPNGNIPAYFPSTFIVGYWNGLGSPPALLPNSSTFGGEPAWQKRWNQIAPRLGLAYRLKSSNLVLRAGGGLFYDTGMPSIVANTNPFTIWQYQPNSQEPTGPVSLPSAVPPTPLTLPKVWEWKASVEKSLSEQSLLSVVYFGSRGTRLLRDEATEDSSSRILQALTFANDGKSSYHSLLANFRGNLTPNLYGMASYTWGHSIDTGSSDTAPVLLNGLSNKGSSDFDVRQSFTATLGYRTPKSLGRVFGGWTLGATALARTGFPFTVTTVDQSIGLGFENADHASLVPGEPVWIYSPGFPGGRSLNPSAFQMPAAGTPGNLGRNSLTGNGLFQIDTSLRRQLRAYRGSSLEAVVSAFNLLNRPSFANPVNYLGSALFGQSTSMTNFMLGSGSPTTGLTPMYQAGGPRTVELSLRFSF